MALFSPCGSFYYPCFCILKLFFITRRLMDVALADSPTGCRQTRQRKALNLFCKTKTKHLPVCDLVCMECCFVVSVELTGHVWLESAAWMNPVGGSTCRLKGKFSPQSKILILPLSCGSIYPSRLFWCELPSFGCREFCLFSNTMELDGTKTQKQRVFPPANCVPAEKKACRKLSRGKC